MTIFVQKNLAVKGIFVFLTQNWAKQAKNSISPPIFAKKKMIFSGNSSHLEKKLKQILQETQEKIQKLKQNEHQVLSCSQKKCKIKNPAKSK